LNVIFDSGFNAGSPSFPAGCDFLIGLDNPEVARARSMNSS
jgi:hypothetical protein